MKILLVEDDESMVTVLTRNLTAQNFVVDAVKDGEMGWSYGSTFDYDLIMLDIMLPKLDGISLCRRFRSEGYTTPILLLTSEDTSTAKVQGLDAGADDYVVKPFDRAELVARIRALLRRSSTNPMPLLSWGELLLNPGSCEVSYNNQPLTLTRKEYELLELLLRDSQHVFSTEEILDRLWSSEDFPSEATVRSHIRRVRHKLASVGAPSDFIATLHGRGYYLKASNPSVESLSPSPIAGQLSEAPDLVYGSAEDLSSGINQTAQQHYLSFLNETWSTTTSFISLEMVKEMEQAVEALQRYSLSPNAQDQAKQVAHKLAGTLGLFGFHKAVHLARQLEHWMGSQDPLLPRQAALMLPLLAGLHQEIQDNPVILPSQIPGGRPPLVLLVGLESSVAEGIATLAESRGLRTTIVPSPAIAATWPTAAGDLPDVLLLQLHTHGHPDETLDNRVEMLEVMHAFAHSVPNLPILVLGDRDTLGDRLEAIRQGGKRFLPPTTAPEQILSIVMQSLGQRGLPAKVMVVDDDPNWLRALPTLLKPWGFKVTTLDDPGQFWAVLQAVSPDVLVLDINMPQVNGYELCQVLRSDLHWQRLPILFLSVLTDIKSQNQAFAVGADDFLCKPIMGVDLANRILNRLQRLQACAS